MTTVLTYSASEIVEDAFLDSGIIPPDQVPEAEDVATGFRILNRLLKLWQVNMHLWLQEEGVVFLNPGQQSYLLGPDGDNATILDTLVTTTIATEAVGGSVSIVVESNEGIFDDDNIGILLDDGVRFWTSVDGVLAGNVINLEDNLPNDAGASVGASVFVYSPENDLDRPLRMYNGRTLTFGDDNEIPVDGWSRQEYMQQPLKSSQGIPVNMYYTPELDNGKLYLWQTANNSDQMLNFTYDKPFEVTADTASQPDIPPEWANALKWAIASELIPGYGVPLDRAQIIIAKADSALQSVRDNSNSSVYDLNVIPDMR